MLGGKRIKGRKHYGKFILGGLLPVTRLSGLVPLGVLFRHPDAGQQEGDADGGYAPQEYFKGSLYGDVYAEGCCK